ncbi:MAG: aspartate aminotransferase family protein, partial [Flavobacteriales bacterium]|nr:aspartate aminotransferase family protein [Flavobacteriales bacterium]
WHPLGIEIDRASGVFLYDTQGKRYLDFISGIGVSNIGHGNPHVLAAIHAQADRYLHAMVYGEFQLRPQREAAAKLVATLSHPLDTCYFVNSGTEANEAALKLARRATGRSTLVSFRGAYHGNTMGSLSVSANEKKKGPFRPLIPGVKFIRFGAIDDLRQIDEQVAGVIVETIQGDAGVRIPDPTYMKQLKQRCADVGAMLICDEIQCGMGRTGTMWAHQAMGFVPDVLTAGKALAGGLPVGCMVAARHHMEQLASDPELGHITTFGGHPLVCAAVSANLDVFSSAIDFDFVRTNGAYIAERLLSHPAVKAVRQIGYYIAVDLEGAEHVQHVVTGCLNDGLLLFWFLSSPWSFRIAPPLTISREETDLALKILVNSLDHV